MGIFFEHGVFHGLEYCENGQPGAPGANNTALCCVIGDNAGIDSKTFIGLAVYDPNILRVSGTSTSFDFNREKYYRCVLDIGRKHSRLSVNGESVSRSFIRPHRKATETQKVGDGANRLPPSIDCGNLTSKGFRFFDNIPFTLVRTSAKGVVLIRQSTKNRRSGPPGLRDYDHYMRQADPSSGGSTDEGETANTDYWGGWDFEPVPGGVDIGF